MSKKAKNKKLSTNKALHIADVIASAEFKNAIKEAVKKGVYRDWGYDGEDEYPFDNFDEDIATNNVIEALNKHLLCNTE